MMNLKNWQFGYKILLLLLFLGSVVLSFFILHTKFLDERAERLDQITATYSNTYSIVYERYQEITDIYFTGMSSRIDLDKKLFEAFHSSDDTNKQIQIRNLLYQNILPIFNQLKSKNLLSINFFLPDNTIFLRMANPESFGQSLPKQRQMPRHVNETKKKYDTFEMSKSGAAFRFSYPVFYEKEFVGHMEFVVDGTAITSTIMKNYSVISNIFLNQKYLYPQYLQNTDQLEKSPFEGYFMSKNVIKEIEQLIGGSLRDVMPSKESIAKIYQNFKSKTPQTLYDERDNITITTIPIIHSITHEIQAIVTIRANGGALKKLNDFYTLAKVFNLIFLVMFFSLLYALLNNIDRKRKVEEEAKEKLITQQKQLVELNKQNTTLLEEQKSLLKLFDKGDAALIKFKKDANFSLEYVSQAIESLLGYDKEIFLSNKISHEHLIHRDDYPRALQEMLDAIAKNSDFFALTPYRVITKEGSIKWVLNHSTTQKDARGEITHFIANLSDITPIKNAEQKLQKFANIIDEHVISTSTDLDGIITTVSHAYEKISGYSKEELIGKPHSIVRHEDMPDSIFADLWESITRDKTWKGEVKSKTKSGGFHWCFVRIVCDFDANGKKIGYTSLRQNITLQKEIEQRSIVDDLTQLFNRRYFNTIFEKEFNRTKRSNAPFFFMMLDVDYFKNYNDTYGHQAGDEALAKIGEVLNSFTKRSSDYAFRLGGEEFGLIAQHNNKEDALAFATQIREEMEAQEIPHSKNRASKFLTISIGLWFKDPSIQDGTNSIYKECDDALYKAKKEGRNRVVLAD